MPSGMGSLIFCLSLTRTASTAEARAPFGRFVLCRWSVYRDFRLCHWHGSISAVSWGHLIATSLQQLVKGPMQGGSQCIDIAVSKAVQSFSHLNMDQCQPSLGGPYQLGALGICLGCLPLCVVSGCFVTCLRSCVSLALCLEVVDGNWLLWFTSRYDRVLRASQWTDSRGEEGGARWACSLSLSLPFSLDVFFESFVAHALVETALSPHDCIVFMCCSFSFN